MFTDEKCDQEIITTYLSLVLDNEDSEEFTVFQSFRDNLMLKIDFETQKGEEISYSDEELGLPISVLAKISMIWKIVDSYAFLKFVDVNVQQLTLKLLQAKLFPMFTKVVRTAMLKVIGENKVTYQNLSKYYEEIATEVQTKLQAIFTIGGIEIQTVNICNTYISDNTYKTFRDQKIEFMQKERALDLQHKAEVMSLENYERKAQIHSKYPDYELGLTEKEKDNAVDRYLIKEQGYKVEGIQKPEEIVLEERDNSVGKINEIFHAKNGIKKSKYIKEIWTIVGSSVALLIGMSLEGFMAFLFSAAGITGIGFSVASIFNKKKGNDSKK